MSRHNTVSGGILRSLGSMFGRKSQRKSRRSVVSVSESLESRQLLTDLAKALYQPAELDHHTGDTSVDSYLVSFNTAVSPNTLKGTSGATTVAAVAEAPNTWLLTYDTPITIQTAADRIAPMSGFRYLAPNFSGARETRAIPNDALFPAQWYIDNTGQTNGTAGMDPNVVEVWDNYIGRGVTVGIVDDGLDFNHEDLLPNNSGRHIDLIDGDTDPTPFSGSIHGTGVAGIIGAAQDNNIGISGVAPGVGLSGVRLLSFSGSLTNPSREFQALSFSNIDISNNSWGPENNGRIQALPFFTDLALQSGVTSGRNGLGRIYVWAAGNGGATGDYVNYDQYASSRHVIAVAAVDHNGFQSQFSERGASLLVSGFSAPAAIMTTDNRLDFGINADPPLPGPPVTTDPDQERYNGVLLNRNYTARRAADTSTAAATVTGVIALMLERNPNLSYRDVMNILVRTARRTDLGDNEWRQNGAGLWINYKYGFGVVDAAAAVAMADPATYVPVAPLQTASTGLQNVNLLIPDNSTTGVTAKINSTSQLAVEHVELVLNASHLRRGDLEVTLISPDGTRSVMAETRDSDTGFDYTNWTFTSTRHRGEKSTGTWTVEVRDLKNGLIGTLDSYELKFYGTELPIGFTISPTSVFEDAGAGAAIGTVSRPSTGNLTQPLVITLSSSDTSEITVPATVTIPAGQRSTTFSIRAEDDFLLDGTQNVRITASIPTFSSSLSLDVLDREGLTLTFDKVLAGENDGPQAVKATVSRTNTDTSPPNNIVAINNELRFYDRTGLLEKTIPVPWPTGNRPVGENVHDVTVMENGRVAVFNGTTQVHLSVLNQSTGQWSHFTPDDLSATIGDFGIGGITTKGNFVYLTDSQLNANDQYGMVRVDVTTGDVVRFGTKEFGTRLFAADGGGSVYELNPGDGAIIKQIPTTAGGIEATAFDGKYLWYFDDSLSTLFKTDPDTGVTVDSFLVQQSNSIFGYAGMAYLNGRIYMIDPFPYFDIIVFDPAQRQIIRRMSVDAANAATFGASVQPDGGLAGNPVRNSLFVGDWFTDKVFEIDADTGVALTNGIGGIRGFSSGLNFSRANGLAVLGNELYAGDGFELKRFTLDGIPLGNVPVSSTNRLSYSGLAGDGLPGLVQTNNRYRDVAFGLDNAIYSLEQAGSIVAKFDPATLDPVGFVTLAAPVRAITIGTDGKIYGADQNGQVIEFSPTGQILRTVSSGLGVLNDIELNIAGRILISSVIGEVAETNLSLTTFNPYSTAAADAFVTFGEHLSRNTAELTVTITNPDTTELTAPITVTIPEGAASVDFYLGTLPDFFRDGTQNVQITVSSAGYVDGSRSIAVNDTEGITVNVVAPQIVESAGNGATQVDVQRTDRNGPYTFGMTQTYSNTNQLNLPDNGTVSSPIVVPSQTSWIRDARVTVNFQHQWLSDLDVYLVSPSGTRIELFTDLRSNGRQMTNTIFDDRASTAILDGAAPFTGRFLPEDTFQGLFHQQTAGTWNLEVTDDNVGQVGALLSWTLELDTEGLSPATVTLETSAIDEAGFLRQVTRTVQIPANQTNVQVNLDAEDDNVLDGPQNVTVRATAVDIAGFSLGQDNVVVLDDEALTLTLNRASVTEAQGAGVLIGTVRRNNTDISAPLVVTLTSNDTSEITVPVSVTIPANAASVNFGITIVDDNLIDGDQTVSISAHAVGYSPDAVASVIVEDQEPVLLLSTASTSVPENKGTISVTVRRQDQSNISQPMTVSLTAANVPAGGNPAITVPASVVIPAGEDRFSFDVIVNDDNLLDGTQVAEIHATAVGAIPGTLQLNITDYETLSVTFNKSAFLENAGLNAAIGTVQRNNTDISQPLVVTLISSDVTELTVPVTVTIAAGAASAEFPITAVNDPDLDGSIAVLVTATAAGYIEGSQSIEVQDHEPPVLSGPTIKVKDERPVISWQPLTGAVRYEVWLSNLSAGLGQIIYAKNVTSSSYMVPEKLGIGKYRVWVRAVDNLEHPGYWSNPRDFQVVTAPSIIAPVTTGSLASATFPTISWTAITDAARYELWVNNLTTSQARVIWKTNLTTSSYRSISEGLGSGTYRAFARAFNAKGEVGDWSTAYEFTVLAAPAVLQPATGGTFDRTPTFSWTAIPGATSYDLWVNRNVSGKGVLAFRNQSVRSTSYTATSDLTDGNYTVWVRAQSGNFFSGWSAARTFSIGAPPTITTPVNNSTTSSRPTIQWTSISETDRYEIWITNVQTNIRVYNLTNLKTTNFTPTTPLAAGNYRVWVRAVSTMGEVTQWSKDVAFTVSAVQQPQQPTENSPLLLTSLLTGLKPTEQPASENRPSDIVAAPESEASVPVVSVPEFVRAAGLATVQASVSKDEAASFDAVMAAWDRSDWWNAELPAVQTERTTDKRQVSKKS